MLVLSWRSSYIYFLCRLLSVVRVGKKSVRSISRMFYCMHLVNVAIDCIQKVLNITQKTVTEHRKKSRPTEKTVDGIQKKVYRTQKIVGRTQKEDRTQKTVHRTQYTEHCN